MCQAAGSAVKKLAGEFAGRPVVFLEYYAGGSVGNRESRFQAAFGGYGYSVPMAIVGSGFRHSQGPADYANVFRSMIQADLARPPQVEIEAWQRRVAPTTLRIYATVRNTSGVGLEHATNEAGVWGLAWEKSSTLGVTGMYTRAALRVPILSAVPPGGSTSVVVDLPINLLVNWNNLHAVVAAELRPGATGAYDMLQAVIPQPAGFSVAPAQVHLVVPQGPGLVEVQLTGPHVLSWSAVPSAPWIVVTPQQGSVATPARVEVRPDLLQPGEQTGSITFTATSPDGLSFVTELPVTASYDPTFTRRPNQPRRHLSRRAPNPGQP